MSSVCISSAIAFRVGSAVTNPPRFQISLLNSIVSTSTASGFLLGECQTYSSHGAGFHGHSSFPERNRQPYVGYDVCQARHCLFCLYCWTVHVSTLPCRLGGCQALFSLCTGYQRLLSTLHCTVAHHNLFTCRVTPMQLMGTTWIPENQLVDFALSLQEEL